MKQVLDTNSNRQKFGVYFLGNDRQIHWAYAFLVSFRKTNPTLPLTLIPYDDNCDQLAALSERFQFDMLVSETLPALDALNAQIGNAIYSHTFRKLASFWGIYDEFFYLDTDIIVTKNLLPLVAAAEEKNLDFAFIETFDDHIDHVYKPGPLREKMVNTYHTRAFNSGAWWSRRGLFSLQDFADAVDETEADRQYLFQGEQPYLNYCCDIKQVRMEHFSDIVPNLMPLSHTSYINGRWDGKQYVQAQGPWAGRDVSMVHYASFGIPHADMPNYKFYLANRAKGQGRLMTQMWNLRWQGQKIKWKILDRLRPRH